jgi:ketosteroid isomerase-like protein
VSAGEELRLLFDGWADRIRAKDVDGSLSHYSPAVLAFDLVGSLRSMGLDAVRARLQDWFSSFDGPIDFENGDLSITRGDDIAFAHSLNHVSGTLKDGTNLNMYWRATECLRKIDGEWTVIHTHTSVPFEIESGKASLDLEP